MAQFRWLSRQHRALVRCQKSCSNPSGFPLSRSPSSFQSPGHGTFHPGLAPISLMKTAQPPCAVRGKGHGPRWGLSHTPEIPEASCLQREGFMTLLEPGQVAAMGRGW